MRRGTAPRVEHRDDGLAIAGELSFDSVAELVRNGLPPMEGEELAVDLSGVIRADSAGVALLVELARRAKAAGVRLRLRNTPEQMLSIMRVSRLEGLLPLDPPPERSS
ncbi:MAG TPA: anti-sigma factor antagonist [Thiotrichales bacterium]|nr:anti-sigma factor antagonist [Thiotrichales bacterium]